MASAGIILGATLSSATQASEADFLPIIKGQLEKLAKEEPTDRTCHEINSKVDKYNDIAKKVRKAELSKNEITIYRKGCERVSLSEIESKLNILSGKPDYEKDCTSIDDLVKQYNQQAAKENKRPLSQDKLSKTFKKCTKGGSPATAEPAAPAPGAHPGQPAGQSSVSKTVAKAHQPLIGTGRVSPPPPSDAPPALPPPGTTPKAGATAPHLPARPRADARGATGSPPRPTHQALDSKADAGAPPPRPTRALPSQPGAPKADAGAPPPPPPAAAPPPPPGAGAPPPPPPPPGSGGTPKPGKGAPKPGAGTPKKGAGVPPAPEHTAPEGHLDAIHKGMKLKRVEPNTNPPPAAAQDDGTLASVLKRALVERRLNMKESQEEIPVPGSHAGKEEWED